MLTKLKEQDFIINGAYSQILAMNNYLVIGDSITSPWAPAEEPKRAMTEELEAVRQTN